MTMIDLNCDMGELKAGQERNFDEDIMPYISSCNIACGFHSGTPELIEQTIKAAIQHDVTIGAHPSYNDRENFGRKSIQVATTTLLAELRYQICALKGIVESFGQRLHHVKAHGALYNDLLQNDTLADHFVRLVKTIDPQLKILSLAHSNVVERCKEHRMGYIREGFADRRYKHRTQLRSRIDTDAVMHHSQDILDQLNGFLQQQIRLADGSSASILVDSICLHSDTQGAVHLSKTIYQFLSDKHIEIRAVE